MSELERRSIQDQLTEIQTILAEREKVAMQNRNLLLGILGILVVSVYAMISDHIQQVDLQKSMERISPQHDVLWWEHQSKKP